MMAIERRSRRAYGAWLGGHGDLLRPGALALDLGCGSGEDARELSDAGLRVIGLDRNVSRLSTAAARVPTGLFIAADLGLGVPLRNESADLVVASLSLHYFDRITLDRILADIARALRHGGTLLCRVNVIGDVASAYGQGAEIEPEFFEVSPGWRKRFFDEETLRVALKPHLQVESLERSTTLVRETSIKQTLIARARRGR